MINDIKTRHEKNEDKDKFKTNDFPMKKCYVFSLTILLICFTSLAYSQCTAIFWMSGVHAGYDTTGATYTFTYPNNQGTQFQAAPKATGTIDPNSTFVSSNTAIASVNSAGLLSLNGVGKCTITATTSGGCKAICNIIVNRPPVTPDANGILYVDSSGALTGDGSSWAKALDSFNLALSTATVNTNIKQIWVAKGTYQPLTNQSFAMVKNVQIYGGFAGTETSLSQRDLSAGHTSVLKGNGSSVILNNNNGLTTADTLDGFTITGGSGSAASGGGGINNLSGSPSIVNCIFSGNHSAYYGGGVAINSGSSPTFTNCVFSGNSTTNGGGGVWISSGSSAFTNCIFSGNIAASGGGGAFNTGDPRFINCVFSGNNTGGLGGGGVFNGTSSAFINCTFSGNKAPSGNGGAIMNSLTAFSTSLTNCIIYGNSDGIDGGTPTVSYSLVQGMSANAANHNLDGGTDPLFVSAPAYSNAPFASGNYQLQSGSPVIDKGNNAALPVNVTTDLAGNPRIIAGIVDMGAYEYQVNPQPPVITGQPANITVCDNAAAAFGITATGATLTYKWQSSADGITWNDISAVVSDSLKLTTVTLADSGRLYRVILNNVWGADTSNTARLTVNDTTAISTQPVDATACDGSATSFTVIAAGPSLSYQWQSSTDGTTWTNVAGATGAMLSLASVSTADNGTRYRAIVSGACDNLTSNTAILTVRAKTAITGQPLTQNLFEGDNASFTVTATGAGLSYQWASSTDNGANWNNISGATGATLTIDNTAVAQSGTQYQVAVTGTCGTIVSTSVTLMVKSRCVAPSITAQPSSQTGCEGTPVSFSVTATGTTPGYQWQSSSDGTNWNNINGATAATLTIANVTAIDNGKQYHAVITGGCGTVTSNTATLTVQTKATISTQPADQAVCGGSAASFSVTAAGTNLSYQWQSSSDGTTWTNVINGTSGILELSNVQVAQSGTEYRVILSSACSNITSDMATLTVNENAAITAQPQNQSVCENGDVTFSVAATGTKTSYQWQSSADGTNWDNVTDGTDPTLNLSSIPASDNGIKYRVLVNSVCMTVASDVVILTVNPLPDIAITADKANPVSKGDEVNLAAAGADTYQWKFVPGIEGGQNNAILQVRPTENETYHVTGTTAAGCSAQKDYAVQIATDYNLIANNIVTPNGDGINDTWFIKNIDVYPNNEVMIFDRSGRMIYYKKNYDNQWNGTINGSLLQEGTYYYVFKVDGGKKIFKGFIELIR